MTFDKLPPELVLMISRYLSPVDMSCLALCNHCFMSHSSKLDTLLGKSWSGVRTGIPNDDLRIDLLTRLARNLPRYYLCFACLRLHLWQYVELPSSKFKLRSCFEAIQDRNSSLLAGANLSLFPNYSFYQFHFVHLHLAMRRYYFGPSFGISAESLMYTEVNPHHRLRHPGTSNFTCRIGLKSIEARVCTNPPGLGLRIKSLAVVKRQEVQSIFDQEDTVGICDHIVTLSSKSPECYNLLLKKFYSDFSDAIKSLIKSYCQQDEAQDGTRQLCRQGKCDRGNTSWKLELRDIEKQDVCLFLTRWKDLGPGLDPGDERWRIEQASAYSATLKPSELVGDPRIRVERPSDCNSPQLCRRRTCFNVICLCYEDSVIEK